MTSSSNQQAVLGGGCFWCTEAIFSRLRGVISVTSGYAGGRVPNPTYEQVCSGDTGHVEVIKVLFDLAKIKYSDLLAVFFATHDPTILNRQGNDVGKQYRSVIFYANNEQRETAQEYINELRREKIFANEIVTAIEPLTTFYPAEAYHRRYYEKNQTQAYCQTVINPKLIKLRAKFAQLLKE